MSLPPPRAGDSPRTLSIELSATEEGRLRAQAERAGFPTSRDYLKHLVQEDRFRMLRERLSDLRRLGGALPVLPWRPGRPERSGAAS